MARYGLRPSRPRAVLVAVLTMAMVVFGIVQFVRGGRFHWFFVLWVAIALGIAGLVLRQGFGGGSGTPVEVDDSDGHPRGSHHLWGMTTEREADGRFAVRPGRTGAVVGAVGGLAIIIFGAFKFYGPFLILWIPFGLAIIGFNLWSAFGRRGATDVLERRD